MTAIPIAPETNTLARRLVSAESHTRSALLAINELIRGDAPSFVVDDELGKALAAATHLSRDLMAWTACDAVREHKMSHIDMLRSMGAFNKGIRMLARAFDMPHTDRPEQIRLHRKIDKAMGVVCGEHRLLRDWCYCKNIPIPDIPTTRDGGR